MRKSKITRKTNETDITIALNLDGSGLADIRTGIAFFDHMLTQIAVHGLFDLSVQAEGDLAVDQHHVIEDVGLTLGEAFRTALGDKSGIVRMGQADVPMDEALARVNIDLSGRPYLVFACMWEDMRVSEIPVSLIEHFFHAFSMEARANLHASVPYGQDNHHKTEALFKALGRALRQAVGIDPRRQDQVPSSKGVL